MVSGVLYVVAAGVLQGVFLLPMDYVREWRWERSWLAFSFFGMLAFNWLFAFATLPRILDIYHELPAAEISRLALFGLGWGLGAVLFGLGMARLGLSLGYPIIMGLIAALGALVPLLFFYPATLLTTKGLLIISGTAVVLMGIVLCSRAASQRDAVADGQRSNLGGGILIAVAAGALSCLPNIGMTFGEVVVRAAREYGASSSMAANAVWALFFTAGFILNAVYCLYLMTRNRSDRPSAGSYGLRNLVLTALMGLLWIGSFYGYGFGAERLGSLGPVVGWPLFIAVSIVVGNLIGFWRGEWRQAPATARLLLGRGLTVLVAAVALIAGSGFA